MFVGEFCEGKRHGRGVFTSHHGVKQTGTWSNGVREGEAEQKYPDGSNFRGSFRHDDKYGAGEFVDGFRATTGGAAL